MISGILEEIKDAARAWSKYRRRGLRAWPSLSMLGKIRELGPDGAAIRGRTTKIPIFDVSQEVSVFDKVLKEQTESDREIIELMYVQHGKPEKKAKKMECSVATLYNKKNDVLVNMIPGWLKYYKKEDS